MSTNKVLIIDFGSQYSSIINRKVKELKIKADLIISTDPKILEKAKNYQAIILSGGPNSVSDKDALSINKEIFNLNKPILGICYGMQLIHQILGGEINTKDFSEFGFCTLEIKKTHPLFDGIPNKSKIWSSHNDAIVKTAKGFETIATTEICCAATCNDEKKIYTLQFHPEVSQCEYGQQIIKNFLFSITKLTPSLENYNLAEEKKEEICSKVQQESVLLALSGGVDSSVLAHLLLESIPNEKIYPVFIDNGLLRTNNQTKIIDYFSAKFKNFKVISSGKEFISALKDVTCPEEKRKIIGRLFIKLFNKNVEELKNTKIKFLAQGTICSDLIESGKKSNNSEVIKSHHNIVGLIEKNNFQVIEPLSDLFKDEIIKMGKTLNVPNWILEQQPFPGPGLAIRIAGAIDEEKLNILKRVDFLFLEEIKEKKLTNLYSQVFAVLLPIKAVGVKGDKRMYGYTAVLRSVKSKDFMTAEISQFPLDFLINISTKIMNLVPEISRVLYDLTTKPAGTIEWE